MKVSKQQLATMTTDELRDVIQWASEYIDKQQNQRKKELWGNVVAAIRKYEKEIDPITIFCRECGNDCSLDELDSDNPGYISIC